MTESNLDKLFDAIRGITRREKKDQPPPGEGMLTHETFVIVGLGNPGREYEGNRHNIGFMIVDKLAEHLTVTFSRTQNKALVTDGRYEGNKVILAKPQTYMNNSGTVVGGLVKFYKIPLSNLLVVYDDVDLPFGAIRMKPSGGSAGQKGMRSILQRLGTQDFPRLRLGIGRPPGRMDAAAYVLQDFKNQEELLIFLARAADAVLSYVKDGIEPAMTVYNRNEK